MPILIVNSPRFHSSSSCSFDNSDSSVSGDSWSACSPLPERIQDFFRRHGYSIDPYESADRQFYELAAYRGWGKSTKRGYRQEFLDLLKEEFAEFALNERPSNPNTPEYKEAFENKFINEIGLNTNGLFYRQLKLEFVISCGSLAIYHHLLLEYGIIDDEEDLPKSKTQAKKLLDQHVFANLVDYSNGIIENFESMRALRYNTKSEFKYYPLRKAKENPIYKALLKSSLK
jgi:hypothetical protein